AGASCGRRGRRLGAGTLAHANRDFIQPSNLHHESSSSRLSFVRRLRSDGAFASRATSTPPDGESSEWPFRSSPPGGAGRAGLSARPTGQSAQGLRLIKRERPLDHPPPPAGAGTGRSTGSTGRREVVSATASPLSENDAQARTTSWF